MEFLGGSMKKYIAFFAFAFVGLCASELDYKDKAVDGWVMYAEKKALDENKTEEVKKIQGEATLNDIHNVLVAIAKELQDTKEELKLLKEYVNPNAPHYITNEKGEKCLANSSADCFEMPIITEGRNIPALANFMKDPSVENAKVWLGVQAKLFNRANNMGVALKFASLEGGAETYPVYGKDMMVSGNSNSKRRETDAIKYHLDKHKNKIGTIIFLGETQALEAAWGPENLARIAYPEGSLYNLLLVFKSDASKKSYDDYFAAHKDTELKKIYENAKKQISQKLFADYKVEVTPTVVAVYKKDKQVINNTIAKGFPTKDELLYGYKQFMILNKILEHKDFHADNIWRVADEK